MSFDLLAPHYRWMEWALAGGKLQRCRTTFISETRHARSALLAGEGNGRFLSAFAKVNGGARLTVLDSSAGMLRQAARSPVFDPNRMEFVLADALLWDPPRDTYDLIVTNFFFDCFRPDQLQEIVSRFAGGATADARWLVSDFCATGGILARWRSRLILAAMYRFFRIVTRLPARRLSPFERIMEANGFVLEHRHVAEWGLLHADVWRRR